ncbi:MAG: DUF1178 family protein [Proteobacteria bacterium]|nr:DUF1178 family protein [Burkholderiales bacterium]
MIIYDFRCHLGHRFEGWFASADDCERQLDTGKLTCPHCDSDDVARVPSAAHLKTGGSRSIAPTSEGRVADGGHAVEGSATADPAHLAAVVDKLRRWVASTEDVGRDFADEARRIHRSDAPERAIRGIATRDEANALNEEGIPVMKVPPHLLSKPH